MFRFSIEQLDLCRFYTAWPVIGQPPGIVIICLTKINLQTLDQQLSI